MVFDRDPRGAVSLGRTRVLGMDGILSPLPVLAVVRGQNPALTRWATICRPSGPVVVASEIGVVGQNKVLSLVCPSSPIPFLRASACEENQN
jgi:hypothetical protein